MIESTIPTNMEEFQIATAIEEVSRKLQNNPQSIEGYPEHKNSPVLVFDIEGNCITGSGQDRFTIEDELQNQHGESYCGRFLLFEQDL